MVKRAQAYVTSQNIETKTGEWLSEIDRFVARRQRLSLDPGQCALLVVDAQNYFAAPEGRAYQPAAAAVVPRIGRLVETWRGKKLSLAFTRHGHRGPEDLGMLGRFFQDYLRREEPDAEILPALSPRPGEPVFDKNTYDAFEGTRLEGWLRSHGLTQVLIAGMLTQLCCETTARAAFVRGFEVYVAADATLTGSERLHLGSLLGLASGVAVVLSVAEIETKCSGCR